MRLAELRSDQCNFQGARAPVAVLPIGAVEQHSRHLPLGTDMLIVQAIAAEVERRLPDQVLLLPPVAVGASDHHLTMAGTVSIGTRAIADVTTRHAVSLHRSSGVSAFLVLNGHGGNQPAGRLAIEDARDAAPDLHMYAVDYWSPMFEILDRRGITHPAGMGHADVIETSILLAHRPDLVARDRIRPDAYHDGLPAAVHTSAGIPERTTFGGVGDPRRASVEQGRELIDAAAAGVIELVEWITSVQATAVRIHEGSPGRRQDNGDGQPVTADRLIDGSHLRVEGGAESNVASHTAGLGVSWPSTAMRCSSRPHVMGSAMPPRTRPGPCSRSRTSG